MNNQAVHVMTIANSIIGVSIIAMPYCFKQCGIILSMLILIVSSVISRLSCHLLLKSAIMARRRTFEFLAFHAFGPFGKFIVEIGLIGFLLGTCIAFFVVMGDLAPAIVVKMTGTKATDTLRTSILMALALFCVLPLGLLRNIDSLSSVCTATIGFYFCLVLKIIVQSIPHIFTNDWIDNVELWRPAGFLQCLPIFSMALFCQTLKTTFVTVAKFVNPFYTNYSQIFEIYQAIPNPSLDKMNGLIRLAVNICTGVYIFVGIFGYIAFSSQTFTGNILMSFPSSLLSEVIKIGFVLSVAFSFPLIIFPCRASLYSLLYKRTYSLHEGVDKYIPEGRFKGLTFMIVFVSLVIGVMIPNIEVVLGLVGSTIGIMICVLFPAMCFICVSTKNTNERILAQLMLFVGIIVMVLGTYANLYAMEEMSTNPITEKVIAREPDILQLIQKDPALKIVDIPTASKFPIGWVPNKESENQQIMKEVRHEPPLPEEPVEPPAIKEAPKEQANFIQKPPDEIGKIKLGSKLKDQNIEKPLVQLEDNNTNKKEPDDPVLQEPPNVGVKEISQDSNKIPEIAEVPLDNKNEKQVIAKPVADIIKDLSNKLPPEVVDPISKMNQKENEIDNKWNGKKGEEVAKEAIEKEDKELLEQEKEKIKEEKKNLDLLKNLEKHNKEQQKIVDEKKKVLEELKIRQAMEDNKNEIDKVKMNAVVEIKEIVNKAIEKLNVIDKQDVKIPSIVGKQLPENFDKIIEKLPVENLINEINKMDDVRPQHDAKNVAPENNDKKQMNVSIEINPKWKELQQQDSKVQNKLNSSNVLAPAINPKKVGPNLENNIQPKIDTNKEIKQTDVENRLNKANLVPLPIVLSNFSGAYKNIIGPIKDMSIDVNSGNVNSLKIKSENKKIESEDKKIKSEDKKIKSEDKKSELNQNINENKKAEQMSLFSVLKGETEKQQAVHREIRSVDEEMNKLPLNVESNKQTVQAIEKEPKESVVVGNPEDSCDKGGNSENIKLHSSTEIPVMKLITRFSNVELVTLKVPDFADLNGDSILKPLKRDLKSYKATRRK